MNKLEKEHNSKSFEKIINREDYDIITLQTELNDYNDASEKEVKSFKREKVLGSIKLKSILKNNKNFKTKNEVVNFVDSLFASVSRELRNKINLMYYVGIPEDKMSKIFDLVSECCEKQTDILNKAKEVYAKEYKEYNEKTGKDFENEVRCATIFLEDEIGNKEIDFADETVDKLTLITDYCCDMDTLFNKANCEEANSRKDITGVRKIGKDFEIEKGKYDLKVNLTKCEKMLPEEIKNNFDREVEKISNYEISK